MLGFSGTHKCRYVRVFVAVWNWSRSSPATCLGLSNLTTTSRFPPFLSLIGQCPFSWDTGTLHLPPSPHWPWWPQLAARPTQRITRRPRRPSRLRCINHGAGSAQITNSVSITPALRTRSIPALRARFEVCLLSRSVAIDGCHSWWRPYCSEMPVMRCSRSRSAQGLPVHIAWLWVGSLASRLGWTGMPGLVLCSHNGGYCAEAHE